jgi:Fic family protein
VPPLLARWLRRITEARGAHMSTRIEGNPMTEQEVREVFARPERRTDVAEIENLNYRDAVQFASQVAGDAKMTAGLDAGLLRALHFLILRDVDHYGTTGQYRTKQNAVRNAGQTIYMPPDPAEVGRLMDELLAWVAGASRGLHPLVTASVAHAEFINIHPFDDGNGRTGRAITSFLMYRGGWWLRGFVSAEQVFGGDVQSYYAALRAFGPKYPGQHTDFTDWVRWFLEGLLRQADTRIEEASRQRLDAEALTAVGDAAQRDRLTTALTYASLFGTVTSREYASEANVSVATAVSDLNWLVAAGHLERLGSGRATRYVPRGVAAAAS